MKVLLINPPYQSLSCRVGLGNWAPYGLLAIGGPLIDAGHEVRLIDAQSRRLSFREILHEVDKAEPDLVMTGHAASTPAHPVCVSMLGTIKQLFPALVTIYGGVYPTFHARDILNGAPAVDFIVRGEGETTSVELISALSRPSECSPSAAVCPEAPRPRPDDALLRRIRGLAYRTNGQVILTEPRTPATDLDAFRVGWELIDNWDRYRSFGMGRAGIVQFSRGCPNRCTYCGQHAFWESWRHRDPSKVADEIAWLSRTHGIRCIMLADENPAASREPWQRFLEEMVSRRVPVSFLLSMCAADVVRDKDILPLYREAGILYALLGIESTDPSVLSRVNKGSTARNDLQACQLLKRHGIFSIMQYAVGFQGETWGTLRSGLRQLIHYGGDYVNVVYATPHGWTAFGREVRQRPVAQADQRRWDYRHAVLAESVLKPWQLLLGVKWMECWFHLRPRRLWQTLRPHDPFRRRQRLWCLWRTGLIFFAEIAEFLFCGASPTAPLTVSDTEQLNIAGPVARSPAGLRRGKAASWWRS